MSDLDIDVMGQLSLQIGNLAKTQERQQRWREMARAAATPAFIPLAKGGVANASGFLVMGFDGPPQGYFWEVKHLAVSGPNVNTTLSSGEIYVFVTASSLDNIANIAGAPPSDWRDYSATIPNTSFYGAGQLVLRNREKLHLIATGLPANQVLVINASLVQFQESAATQAYEI